MSPSLPQRHRVISAMLGLCSLLAACGGGGDLLDTHAAAIDALPGGVAVGIETSNAAAQLQATAALEATRVTVKSPVTLPIPIDSAATVSLAAVSAAGTESPSGGQTSSSPVVAAAPAISLVMAASAADPTVSRIGKTASCIEGFVNDASLDRKAALPLPASGGATFNAVDLARWRLRITGTAYVRDNDVQAGSPGDWTRITQNANAFLSNGEARVTADNRPVHGINARDAAFYGLVTGQSRYREAAAAYLLQMAQATENNFVQTLCYRSADGSTADGSFNEAPWLLRHLVTYDYVREAMSADQRLTMENYFRRQAYFLATQLDWGLRMVFPNRLSGNYSVRDRDAAPAIAEATWVTRRFDTNADCTVDAKDDARNLPAYTHVDGNGSRGNRIPVLGIWFNNRRSANMLAFGAAGLVLDDALLIDRSKRYAMEWLTYGVFGDGSSAEYYRNGNYCVSKQGVQYDQANLQAAALMASWLAKRGDTSLVAFSTTDGLFGTESGSSGKPKSLSLVIQAHLNLVSGQVAWYFDEPWRSSPKPRAETSLGKVEQYYFGTSAFDSYHELGLLSAADAFPGLPIAAVVKRDKSVTSNRLPGATGNRVSSGAASWSDVFAALPAILLLY